MNPIQANSTGNLQHPYQTVNDDNLESQEEIQIPLERRLSNLEKVVNRLQTKIEPLLRCLPDWHCSRSFLPILGGTTSLTAGAFASSIVLIVHKINHFSDQIGAVTSALAGFGLALHSGNNLRHVGRVVKLRRQARLNNQLDSLPPISPQAYRTGLLHLILGAGAFAITTYYYHRYEKI